MSAIFKILFCVSVLILSAYLQVPLLDYDSAADKFVFFDYSITYICCFVLSIAFRNNYSFVAVLIYLAIGLLGLPVFAFGGGFSYIFEPSFGYLLGLIPLSLIAFYAQMHCSNSGIAFLGVKLLPLLAILIAHVLGLVFLLITLRFDFDKLVNFSSLQLLYDLLIGYLFLVFVKTNVRDISYR